MWKSSYFIEMREANVPVYINHHLNLHTERDDFAKLSQHSAKFIKELSDKMFGTSNISPSNYIDTYVRSWTLRSRRAHRVLVLAFLYGGFHPPKCQLVRKSRHIICPFLAPQVL